MQEHATNAITSLVEEIKELNPSFKKLESDLIILYLKLTIKADITIKNSYAAKKHAKFTSTA